MKNIRKIIMFVSMVVFLCLIVAVMILLMPNNDEKSFSHQLQLGEKYLEELEYERAIVAFNEAIKIDPAHADAYLGLADAYIGSEDLDAAVKVLEEGYELTGSNEILQKLGELQGMNEEAKIEEPAEDKEEYVTHYYELGFSPEDFTVAGYSVMDGDHIDDVLQAAAEIMPHEDDVKHENEYDGWSYHTDSYNNVYIGYHTPRFGKIYCEPVSYSPSHGFTILVTIPMLYLDMDIPADDPANEIPLYEGPIFPYASYEESLDILGIRQLIQAVEATESKSLEFESQYGTGHCSKYEEVQEGISIISYYLRIEKKWCLDFEVRDNVICWIRITYYI